MTDERDLTEIRKNAYSTVRPLGWPPHVRPITMVGLGLFGIDPHTNELFWDGEKLITEKRFSTFERSLAIAGLRIGGVGVLAAVVQAWAAVVALNSPL
jgi:hypothetical protein